MPREPSTLVFAAGRVLAQALEFAAWVVVAGSLPLADSGVLALTLLAARYVGFLADWGAQYTGARDVVLHGPGGPPVLALVARREQLTAPLTVGWVGATMLSGHGDLTLLAALLPARGLTRDWLAYGQGRAVRAVIPLLGQHACTLVLVVGATTRSAAVVAYALGAGVGVALSLLLVRRPRRSGSVANSPDARQHDPTGGPADIPVPGRSNGAYVVVGVASLASATIDAFLLGWLDSPEAVGLYTSAARLPNAWLLVVGLAVTALVPRVTASLDSADGLDELATRLRRCALVLPCVALVTTPVAVALLPRLYDQRFVAADTTLTLLMVGAAAVTAGACYQVLVIARGSDRAVARVLTAGAVFNLVANLAVIPRFGMEGAAATTLITQVGTALYYVGAGRSVLTRWR